MMPNSVSVVIPTYQRPDWIKRAVRSLARQTRVPDEVLAVARDTDAPTHASIDELSRETLPFPLRKATVSTPGFMPPVAEGFREATGDIIAVIDDDAEALEDLCERMLGHYACADVGAVGGRCIIMRNDSDVDWVGRSSRVGHVSPWGKVVGDMYKELTFEEPVDVQFLMGGCMSYRRSIAQALHMDWALNRVVASHYELDLGLQVRQMGYRIVFDPKMAIRHYPAPRAVPGLRSRDDRDAVRWASYNETRIVLRRLPIHFGIAHLARGLLVGYRRTPGVLPWMFGPIARRFGFATSVTPAAINGRLQAVANVFSERFHAIREGNRSIEHS